MLGVRGSTPAPGAAFVRYGGHTSAVAVVGEGDERPTLVLDAGTGLRDLPGLLGAEPFRGTIVLSHLHWDHVQGIPFCIAVDRPDAAVDLYVPGPWQASSMPEDASQLLARAMSPPHFPIPPTGLRGAWRIMPARPGVVPTPGRPVVTLTPVAHKGGVTFGVRVELDGVSIAYLPDHAVSGPSVAPATVALVAGVDVLLHDGQFTASESATAAAYGHATIEAALALADTAQAGRIVLTHHAPGRTDEEIDLLAERFARTPAGRPVSFARQGESIEVCGSVARGARPAGVR